MMELIQYVMQYHDAKKHHKSSLALNVWPQLFYVLLCIALL